jgi:hypothetical protein
MSRHGHAQQVGPWEKPMQWSPTVKSQSTLSRLGLTLTSM